MSPFKKSFNKIERIYAHLGMVHVEGKDGSLHTMTPKEAASRAMLLNESLPEEPSSRKVALEAIDEMIKACREAKRQQECPANSTIDAVVKAVNQSEKDYKRAVAPQYQLLMDKYKIQFPMLSHDELRVVVEHPTWTESYKEGMLKAYNDERTAVWLRDGKMTAPI